MLNSLFVSFVLAFQIYFSENVFFIIRDQSEIILNLQ